MRNRKKFYAYRAPWADRVEFFYFENDPDGKRYTIETVTRKEFVEGIENTPTFTLSEEEAQEFINALWDNGFRPTKYENPNAALQAQSNHLADMREIAFMFLKAKKADGN